NVGQVRLAVMGTVVPGSPQNWGGCKRQERKPTNPGLQATPVRDGTVKSLVRKKRQPGETPANDDRYKPRQKPGYGTFGEQEDAQANHGIVKGKQQQPQRCRQPRLSG